MRNTFFTLGLLVLAACSHEESSEAHLARAKEFLKASDVPAATIELQNALQLDGDSAESRWLLGKIHLDAGDILAAEKEVQRAQELGWKADDIRPALAKTLLGQGKFAEVLALESQDLSPSSAAKVLTSQALAALSNNQPDKARALVAQALSKDPQLLEAKLAEATMAVYEGDPTDALNRVEPILASAPETGEAWWLKGQALVQQGKLEDARSAFDQSIAHSSIGFADRVARALVSVQLEDYAAAQADAKELLKKSPKNPAANYVQGVLDFQNKQYGNAIESLTLAVPAAQQFPLGLFYLSMSYLIKKQLDPAEKFGQQFVLLQPDNREGRKLLAAILLLQNKTKDAQDLLQPVLDQNPDDAQALNLMANALLLDDKADIGMTLYALIAQLQPDWRYIPLRLEAELVAPGIDEKSDPRTKSEPDNTANFPQSDILSILNHLARKDFPGAIEAATHYHLQDFESLAPYRVLGRVYFVADQPAEAKGAFEKVLEREPGDPAANLSLAEIALAADDPKAARRYYQAVLDHHPDDLTILLQLSALEARDKNATAMVARLNQAIEAHPMALEPRLRLARYYLSSGSQDKVEPLFSKLTALQRRSPRVLEMTGLAQLAQKLNDSALATLQQLVDDNPASAQAHYLLALAAYATGNQQGTKRELKEAIQRDAQHVPSLIELAIIARNEGEQGQFEQYLATLVGLAPEAPEVLRLRTLSAHTAGNDAEALVLSQRVFKEAPTTQAVLELATYQKAAGQNAAARNTLQQWIKDHPKDIYVRLFLANDLELENDKAGAQAQYLAVLEEASDNITALNNVAWNLRLENPQKALEYIRRASTLAPDQPDLLDTLAVIESLNGDHKSAQTNIQRALAARPDSISMRYHEAMITAALGDKAQAIAALEKLVTNEINEFPERAEAEALLKALKG
jgi:cellulose synthase operon protein C